jgi:pyruvate formate lyase activating enzyme
MLSTAPSTEPRRDMSEAQQLTSLQAKSPFEMRVNLRQDLPESDVRTALATGDMGFLHSFTTGSAVARPGVRVVAWTAGCQFRCLYCHNPDTWTMSNGIPVTLARAAEEPRKYRQGLKIMSGGFTLRGGEPLMQDRFAVKLFTAAKAMGIHTALDTNGALGSRSPMPNWSRSTLCSWISRLGIRNAIVISREWTILRPWTSRDGWPTAEKEPG